MYWIFLYEVHSRHYNGDDIAKKQNITIRHIQILKTNSMHLFILTPSQDSTAFVRISKMYMKNRQIIPVGFNHYDICQVNID